MYYTLAASASYILHPRCFSIIEIAAIVELILYPAFMALRVTLQPVPPPPPAAEAAAVGHRGANADTGVN